MHELVGIHGEQTRRVEAGKPIVALDGDANG